MHPHPLSAQGTYQQFMPRQMQSIEESIRESRDLTIEEMRKLREAVCELTASIKEHRQGSGYRGDAQPEERIVPQWRQQQEGWNQVWNQMAQMHWQSRQENERLQQEIRLFRGDLQKLFQAAQPAEMIAGTEVQ